MVVCISLGADVDGEGGCVKVDAIPFDEAREGAVVCQLSWSSHYKMTACILCGRNAIRYVSLHHPELVSQLDG